MQRRKEFSDGVFTNAGLPDRTPDQPVSINLYGTQTDFNYKLRRHPSDEPTDPALLPSVLLQGRHNRWRGVPDAEPATALAPEIPLPDPTSSPRE